MKRTIIVLDEDGKEIDRTEIDLDEIARRPNINIIRAFQIGQFVGHGEFEDVANIYLE